jgi:hypothetical protein
MPTIWCCRSGGSFEKEVSVDGTTWFDADDATGPIILVGQDVYFRVAVTNNSTGGLTATVNLDDAILIGGGTAHDFTFGGLQTTTVAAGTTVYSDIVTDTALAGQNEDRASADATVSDGVNDTPVPVDPDDANYFGAAGAVVIEKQVSADGTNWFDADDATGPIIAVGQSVFFRVAVTNNSTGNLAATVDLSDSILVGGGTAHDFTFAGLQTTTVAAGSTIYSDVVTDVALAGQNEDQASATATVTDGTNTGTVTVAPDDANYLGAEGGVFIQKEVSVDGTTWFDADDATGPIILVGQDVYFRVAVTNNSTGGLTATVNLDDAILIGGGTAHDFTFGGLQTTTVAAGTTVYSDIVTDTALAGQNEDRASADATVSDGVNDTPVPVDPDDANYFGAAGAVVIEKQVSADGTNWFDADDATGPIIAVGQSVFFRVAVTNNSTGNLAATVDLSDSILVGGGTAHDFTFAGLQTTTVAAGSTIYSDVVTDVALAGQNEDQASATATVTDGTNTGTVTVAPDDANYLGAEGGVFIQKEVSVDGTTWFDADDATGPIILVGQDVYFRVAVTNNSTGGLTATVNLDDAILIGGGTAHDFTFGGLQTTTVAAGTTVYSDIVTDTALAGQNEDRASADATVSDGVNDTPVPVDPDDANYFGAAGAVVIEKQVSADGTNWFDADDATGPIIAVGQSVFFRVAVTNNSTGNLAATVDLSDSILVGGGTAHDFTFAGLQTTTVAAGSTIYSDVVTDVALAGQNEDQASATATVTDGTNTGTVTVAPDDANYLGAEGGVFIQKEVSVDGTTWFDADDATGPIILVGQDVYFRVAVTNNSTGGLTATVNLDDAILIGGGTAHDFTFGGLQTTTVAAGTTVYSDIVTDTALAGQNEDRASADATVSDGVNDTPVPVDPDDANYFGAAGAVVIEKQVSADGTNWFDADDATGPIIAVGQSVFFRVAVTNNSTGNLAATVDLSDSILVGGGTAHDFTFAGLQTTTVAAGSTIYSDVVTDVALAGQNEDQASATATVTDGTNTGTVTVAPDDANYLGAEGGVFIQKEVSVDGTTWFDADDATGPIILVGQDVYFRVAVTNNSTGGLTATVNLDDAILIGGGTAHDFTFGGLQTTTVAAGTTVYSDIVTDTALAGQNEDRASADATVSDGVNDTPVPVDPDDANYFGAAGAVVIEKQVSADGTNWFDADDATGPIIAVGQSVFFRVAVTNNSTGNLAATVDLSDSILVGGGTAHDFTFAGLQTTTVAAGSTIYSDVVTDVALAGQNEDQASATATVTDGTNTGTVTVAPDDANYLGAEGGVFIQKEVSVDGTTWFDADDATGPIILVGQDVYFRVAVTNNSTGGLTATVNLDDAILIGGGTAHDFTFGGLQTTTVAAGTTVYSDIVTDTALAGQNEDRASADATVSDGVNDTPVPVDPDDANYFGAAGAVVIEKQVSADGTNWFDADDATGPIIAVGQSVFFRVAVTNNSTGNLAATVDLSDSILVGGGTAHDFTFAGLQTTTVAAGSTIYSDVVTDVALAGQNEDQASATATVTDGTNTGTVTVAPDDANYLGAEGGVFIQKEVSVDGTTWFDADDATGPIILVGQDVYFRVAVTNNSTGGLTATVNLDDAILIGGGTAHDFTFGGLQTTTVAAGTTVYSDIVTDTALAGQNEDRASADATVSDGVNDTPVPVDPDDANYFGAAGAVVIEKQVSADGTNWFDADDATGPIIAVGQSVFFRVAVTNNSTGNLAATVDLSDSILVGGGTAHDFTFAGLQTTTVAAGSTIYSDVVTDVALAGQNEDQASATATVTDGTNTGTVTVAPDDANYLGAEGGVFIQKEVSVDGTTWFDADDATGPIILVGQDVYFRVAVTNNSTGGLTATVNLDDAILIGGGTAHDFTFGGLQTTTVAAGTTVYSDIVTDTALAGQNEDRASADATVSDGVNDTPVPVDPDDANYFGAAGAVVIEKQVSADGTNWFDADDATGPIIAVGQSVFFRVAVTNNSTGNLAATVDLSDSILVGGGTAHDFTFAGLQTTTVAAGSTIYSDVVTDVALAGQNEDQASATATVTDGTNTGTVTVAPDDANYLGAEGGVFIQKEVSVDGTTWFDADDATGPIILVGQDVYFRVAVTNNSTGGLTATVNLDDAILIGGGTAHDFTFGGLQTTTVAAGTTVYSDIVTDTALAGQNEDRASADATVSDGVNDTPVPVDPDDANYFGAAGAVVIEKQVSADGTNWFDADDATGPIIAVGQSVFFRVAVTNNSTGNLAATVDLSDSILVGGGTAHDFTFAGLQTTTVAAGSTIYSDVVTDVALAGQNEDQASATATVTDGTNTGTVTVAPDDANYFGLEERGSIGDRVWEDMNYNGIQDPGEPGLGGFVVNLLDASGSPTGLSMNTDASGNYLFSNLAAGDYRIQVLAQPGYYFTKPNVGPDALDSDVDSSGVTSIINLSPGESELDWDAGLYLKATLGDRVWLDRDKDGIQDANEAGVGHVGVTLLDAGGGVLATTTTDVFGNYLFSNLDPGTYGLEFNKAAAATGAISVAKYPWTQQNAGGNPNLDSDVKVDPGNPNLAFTTAPIVLTSGENDLSWDAGITPIVIDLNGDGIHTISRADSQGTFDLLGTGVGIKSGWLSGEDGFLVIDGNANDRIDDISEMFGGSQKGDGFAKLASFDSNRDGVVDASDADFASLKVWQDANGNHQTDVGELISLADAGVVSLSLDFTELPFRDAQDNLHLERSSAILSDGAVVDMTDVYLNVSAFDAAAAGVSLPSLGELMSSDNSLDGLWSNPELDWVLQEDQPLETTSSDAFGGTPMDYSVDASAAADLNTLEVQPQFACCDLF